MQPEVSVIIVNWNGFGDTRELLESFKSVTYSNYKIYVVDNNSSGDDVSKLQSCYGDKINIIRNNFNAGFSGGNNSGIKAALKNNTDFILLINNDTTVEPDFLTILVTGFNDSDSAGITAPRINYYHERGKIWSSGGNISRIRGSGFAVADVMENNTDKKIKEVTFVSGCCMLIKKEVFESIGFFDDNYFLYLEDTDLCCRTLKAGYKIFLYPEAKIYHKVKSSSLRLSTSTLYYETRNRLFFAKKNYKGLFPFTFVYILITMTIKSIYWILTGNQENYITVKESFMDFFKGKMGPKDFKLKEAA